jgi:hypothetical protein
VVAGVVALAILIGIAFWLRKKQARTHADVDHSHAPAAQPYPPSVAPESPHNAGFGGGGMQGMSQYGTTQASVAGSTFTPQRLYDPSDPSTYPASSGTVSPRPETFYGSNPQLTSAGHSGAPSNPFQTPGGQAYQPQPHYGNQPGYHGGYTGAPEV